MAQTTYNLEKTLQSALRHLRACCEQMKGTYDENVWPLKPLQSRLDAEYFLECLPPAAGRLEDSARVYSSPNTPTRLYFVHHHLGNIRVTRDEFWRLRDLQNAEDGAYTYHKNSEFKFKYYKVTTGGGYVSHSV